jgi:hypothetical protein
VFESGKAKNSCENDRNMMKGGRVLCTDKTETIAKRMSRKHELRPDHREAMQHRHGTIVKRMDWQTAYLEYCSHIYCQVLDTVESTRAWRKHAKIEMTPLLLQWPCRTAVVLAISTSFVRAFFV